MKETEQGMVIPFKLSGSRMRRSAQEYRRRGQPLEALLFLRRAAEQEDTPSGWKQLAAELRQMGNWETAAQLLARVVSRDAHQPGVWMELARCMRALGQTAPALDCVYHQLQEDPWSQEGDAARDMLQEIETIPERKEPKRTPRLIQRGVGAWQTGDRARGERRVRRALKMTLEKERLLVTAAMMCLLEMDLEGGLRYLTRALKYAPEDPRTLTALATLYHQLGKRRMGRGFLEKAGAHADTVLEEDGFLTTAWAQDAWPQMAAYLDSRMKRYPHRIPLLSARATMCCEQGDVPGAQRLWREILSIDPDDRQAATMIAWTQQHTGPVINAPGLLPRGERLRQMKELKLLAESLPLAELLRPGSRGRRLVDWAVLSGDPEERQYVLELLGTANDAEAALPYLRELLCMPLLRYETRQWALVKAAEMGCRDEMLIMTGSHFTTVSCQPVSEEKAQQPWRLFLRLLLEETRRFRRGAEIAAFAAGIWRCMTPEERREAADEKRYVWCKAVEILYLREQGRGEEAAEVALSAPLSTRRISRVLRRIAGRGMETTTESSPVTPEKETQV